MTVKPESLDRQCDRLLHLAKQATGGTHCHEALRSIRTHEDEPKPLLGGP